MKKRRNASDVCDSEESFPRRKRKRMKIGTRMLLQLLLT